MIAAELKNNFMEISDHAERLLYPQRFPDLSNEETKRNVKEQHQSNKFGKKTVMVNIEKVKIGSEEEEKGEGMREGRGEVERMKEGVKEGRGEDYLHKDEKELNDDKREFLNKMDTQGGPDCDNKVENAGEKLGREREREGEGEGREGESEGGEEIDYQPNIGIEKKEKKVETDDERYTGFKKRDDNVLPSSSSSSFSSTSSSSSSSSSSFSSAPLLTAMKNGMTPTLSAVAFATPPCVSEVRTATSLCYNKISLLLILVKYFDTVLTTSFPLSLPLSTYYLNVGILVENDHFSFLFLLHYLFYSISYFVIFYLVLTYHTRSYQMMSDYIKLYQIMSNYIKLYQMMSNYIKLYQITSNYIK